MRDDNQVSQRLRKSPCAPCAGEGRNVIIQNGDKPQRGLWSQPSWMNYGYESSTGGKVMREGLWPVDNGGLNRSILSRWEGAFALFLKQWVFLYGKQLGPKPKCDLPLWPKRTGKGGRMWRKTLLLFAGQDAFIPSRSLEPTIILVTGRDLSLPAVSGWPGRVPNLVFEWIHKHGRVSHSLTFPSI